VRVLLHYTAAALLALAIFAVSPGQEPPAIKVAAPTPESIKAEVIREQKQALYDQAEEVASRVMVKHGCDDQFAELVAHAAVDRRLPARIVAAVVVAESTCNPNAANHGDCGLMQVNARIWNMSCQVLKDPVTNVTKATQILAACVHKAGGIREGLHRYNGLDKPADQYADKVFSIAYGGKRV